MMMMIIYLCQPVTEMTTKILEIELALNLMNQLTAIVLGLDLIYHLFTYLCICFGLFCTPNFGLHLV